MKLNYLKNSRTQPRPFNKIEKNVYLLIFEILIFKMF